MIDIFYKSYKNDFDWLYLSLKSLNKFITGYNKVIIVIPREDERFFDYSSLDNINHKVILTDEYGNRYLYQQWIKISAYRYCESEYILFVDSDCIFDKNFNLSNLIDKKIEVLYTDYSKVGDAICWKEPTEKFIGRKVDYEFMRRNFLIYRCETLMKINESYIDLESYIMNSSVFSEFNAIGAWAYFNDNDNYHFINTDFAENLYSIGRQFWSYSGLNDDDLKEIKNILNKDENN